MIFAATTSPWWGIPVVAGAFAVGGILITQFGLSRSDRRKIASERQKDERQELQEAFTKYLTARANVEDCLSVPRTVFTQVRADEALLAVNSFRREYEQLAITVGGPGLTVLFVDRQAFSHWSAEQVRYLKSEAETTSLPPSANPVRALAKQEIDKLRL